MPVRTYDIVQPPNFEQLHREIDRARELGQVGIGLTVVEREISELDRRRRGDSPSQEELYFVPELRSYGDESIVGRVQTDAAENAETYLGGARVSRSDLRRPADGLMLTVVRS